MFNSQYPMTFTEEPDGGYTVEISHKNKRFQGTTEGDNFEEAMANAHSLLGEMFMSAIEDGENIPAPSECDNGTHNIAVPPLAAAKAVIYQEMKKQGMKKVTLARKLDCAPTQIDRIVEPRHKSTFAQMDAAFAALGKQMVIGVENIA